MHRLVLALLLASSWAASALAQPTPPGGPAAHRLLVAPTARAIPAGRVTLGTTQILIPNVSAGLGGGVSLGAGVVVGPEPVNAGIGFVEPKVTLVDRLDLAVALGATARIDPFHSDGVEANIFSYAVTTVGDASRPGGLAATLGLGARVNVERSIDPTVFYGDPFVDPLPPTRGDHRADLVPAPAVFAGLELAAGRRVTVLLEATALPDRDPIAFLPYCPVCRTGDERLATEPGYSATHYDLTGSAAVRFATRRAALDLGLGVLREEEIGGDPFLVPTLWLNGAIGLGQ